MLPSVVDPVPNRQNTAVGTQLKGQQQLVGGKQFRWLPAGLRRVEESGCKREHGQGNGEHDQLAGD